MCRTRVVCVRRCSKLANPHYTPETFAQLTVINFTVTMNGLEQQLLGRVLGFERAELEEQKQKLVEVRMPSL